MIKDNPSKINKVYVIFDEFVNVCKIRIYNYTKNFNRGLYEFNILVDGLLVKNGYAPSSEEQLYFDIFLDINLNSLPGTPGSGTPSTLEYKRDSSNNSCNSQTSKNSRRVWQQQKDV